MIKGLFAAALVLAATVSPASILAQDDDAPAIDMTAAETLAASTIPLAANPDITQDPENILFLDLSNGKRVAIRLVQQWAPSHVERIKTLTRQGFYDGVIFRRAIDGFLAQTGDHSSTRQGGSELPYLTDEVNVSYTDSESQRLSDYFQSGRQFYAGVRYSF